MSCPVKQLISREAKKVKISHKKGDRFLVKKMSEPKGFLVEVHEHLMGGSKYLVFKAGKNEPWMVDEKNVEWFEIDNEHISVGMGSFLR
jgi:hypothetical protein